MKTISKMSVLTLVLLVSNAAAQISTGGSYTLDQAAIAGGGGTSGGGSYGVSGTAAQPAAGTDQTGGAYTLKGGFWSAFLAPSAAGVAVSGRVTQSSGIGLRNVRVTLNGGPLTTPRIAITSSLGYFTFDDVEVGETYVISVSSKQYGFGQPTQIISVVDNVTDLTFVSTWQN